jgi:hypothetical protein
MDFMNKFYFVLALLFIVSGCSAHKDYYATGGSRGDGAIDMAYDFKMFETPLVNSDQAKEIATQKCKIWGYDSADAFGGQVENCFARNGYGDCLRGQMVVKYQCTGNLGSQSHQQPSGSTISNTMSKDAYKQMQTKKIMESNLPYDEYMRQMKIIEAN